MEFIKKAHKPIPVMHLGNQAHSTQEDKAGSVERPDAWLLEDAIKAIQTFGSIGSGKKYGMPQHVGLNKNGIS